MGWSVGAGLMILLLLALSVTAALLSVLRFATPSERTHPACIAAPAFAGFGVAAFLRFGTPATITFTILGTGTIFCVGIGCLIACIPLQSR